MNIRSTVFRSPLTRALPAAFCSLLMIGSTAQAAEGFYVLGSVGQSRFHDDASKSDKDAYLADLIGDEPDSSKQDDKDTGYKVQVGYQFNDNFAVEGGYFDLGEQVYTASYGVDGGAKSKMSAEGWNIDALLTLPINAGVSLFAKVGAASAKLEVKDSIDAFGYADSASEKETKVAAKFGVGVAYNFFEGWSARVEAERYSNLGDSNSTGKADVDLYSAGVSYKF